jgi:hypothetical protein
MGLTGPITLTGEWSGRSAERTHLPKLTKGYARRSRRGFCRFCHNCQARPACGDVGSSHFRTFIARPFAAADILLSTCVTWAVRYASRCPTACRLITSARQPDHPSLWRSAATCQVEPTAGASDKALFTKRLFKRARYTDQIAIRQLRITRQRESARGNILGIGQSLPTGIHRHCVGALVGP